MIVVDMILVPVPACKFACEVYMEFWTKYAAAINVLFDPSARHVRRQDCKLLDQLMLAEPLGIEASKEPRFWRTPWRHGLWTDALNSAFHLRIDLVTIENSLAGGKTVNSQDLLRLLASPAFETLKEHVMAKVFAIQILLDALAWEKETDGFHTIDVERATRSCCSEAASLRPALERQLAFEITDADEERYLADVQAVLFESAAKNSADHGSLEEDSLSRLSVVFIAISLLLRHLDDLKHRLLREGV
jgi:hypothetical protein